MFLSAWLKVLWLDEIEAAIAGAVEDENLEEQGPLSDDSSVL